MTDEVPKACSCQHPKYWSFSEPLKDGQSVKCEMNKFDNMMDARLNFTLLKVITFVCSRFLLVSFW